MLKTNVVALVEWLWRTAIKIAPWPIDKFIEKWYWARGEKWFHETMREDIAFKTMVETVFEMAENPTANEGRYEEIYYKSLEVNKQLKSESQGC